MTNFIPVILAGGSGERFWPLSRRSKPKQFLRLDGTSRSLIQATADRLLPLCGGLEALYIVAGASHQDLILDHLPGLPETNLVIEPVSRDTAPAVLLAALRVRDRCGPDAIVGIFPSDHHIGDPIGFRETVGAAIDAAGSEDGLVTLGITPTHPATGYGYIETAQRLRSFELHTLYRASRFVEKPDRETAERFLTSGQFLWNAGMFVFRVGRLIKEFERHAPEYLRALETAHEGGDETLRAAFERVPKLPLDRAIMERSANVQVIPSAFGWDDLGDWNALARLIQGTAQNATVGRHLGLDTSGTILYTTTGEDLIVTIGLEDVVIVRDGNVTLVARKDRTQDIKRLVERMKSTPELEKYV